MMQLIWDLFFFLLQQNLKERKKKERKKVIPRMKKENGGWGGVVMAGTGRGELLRVAVRRLHLRTIIQNLPTDG